VPWLGFIAWIVQDHQALDDGTAEIANGSVANLPAENAEPTDEVRKLLLRSRRAKFGNPVYEDVKINNISILSLLEHLRYWPPVVGAMLAISAMEQIARKNPANAPMYT
jgi:hypothetical protein